MWNWLKALRRMSLPVMRLELPPVQRPAPLLKSPLHVWTWEGVGAAKARTKSEARAVFKRRLGLKRLPVGVVLTRVAPGAALAVV